MSALICLKISLADRPRKWYNIVIKLLVLYYFSRR